MHFFKVMKLLNLRLLLHGVVGHFIRQHPPRFPPSPQLPHAPPPPPPSPRLALVREGPNPFGGHPFYVPHHTSPLTSHASNLRSLPAGNTTLNNLDIITAAPSAYWIDTRAKIGRAGENRLDTLHGILGDAASQVPPPLVVFILYNLPNRDCHVRQPNLNPLPMATRSSEASDPYTHHPWLSISSPCRTTSWARKGLGSTSSPANGVWVAFTLVVRWSIHASYHGSTQDGSAVLRPSRCLSLYPPPCVFQAKASNGELCCTYLSDGSCDFTAPSDCATGIRQYETEYVDPFAAALSAPAYRGVPAVVILEPDSLPNLATNLKDPRCGSYATRQAYTLGATYAIETLAREAPHVALYQDAGHGGWLGWPAEVRPSRAISYRPAPLHPSSRTAPVLSMIVH
jgi:hypothetical protein